MKEANGREGRIAVVRISAATSVVLRIMVAISAIWRS